MKISDILNENLGWEDNPSDDEEYRRAYPGYEEDLIRSAEDLKKVPEDSEESDRKFEELSRELADRYGMPLDHAMRNLDNTYHGRTMWATGSSIGR